MNEVLRHPKIFVPDVAILRLRHANSYFKSATPNYAYLLTVLSPAHHHRDKQRDRPCYATQEQVLFAG